MAEVRTTSSTGGQKGTKLARVDLIPPGPLLELAEHFGVGASKYANHQWRNGYEWSKSYAAIMRHLLAFWAGFDYDVCSNDPEGCSHVDAEGNPFVAVRDDACFNHTGSHHMAAVAWHAFCLLEFKDRFPQHDDRYKPEPKCSECSCDDDLGPDEDGGIQGFRPTMVLWDEAAEFVKAQRAETWSDLGAAIDRTTFHGTEEPDAIQAKLPEEWQDLGYTTDFQVYEPFATMDLDPIIQRINDIVKALAQGTFVTRFTTGIDGVTTDSQPPKSSAKPWLKSSWGSPVTNFVLNEDGVVTERAARERVLSDAVVRGVETARQAVQRSFERR